MKMIFGFLTKGQRRGGGPHRRSENQEEKDTAVRKSCESPTYLVTKHLSTSSCLHTNSMKRGEVILMEVRQEGGGEEEEEDVQAVNRRQCWVLLLIRLAHNKVI